VGDIKAQKLPPQILTDDAMCYIRSDYHTSPMSPQCRKSCRKFVAS